MTGNPGTGGAPYSMRSPTAPSRRPEELLAAIEAETASLQLTCKQQSNIANFSAFLLLIGFIGGFFFSFWFYLLVIASVLMGVTQHGPSREVERLAFLTRAKALVPQLASAEFEDEDDAEWARSMLRQIEDEVFPVSRVPTPSPTLLVRTPSAAEKRRERIEPRF